jgi:hypothetical protein
MTKKIIPLDSYISASQAATLLSQKLGRPVRPSYIRRLKNVRTHEVNATTKLYNQEDILAASIRKRESKRDMLTDTQKHYVKLFADGQCTDGYLMTKLGIFEWKDAEKLIEQYKREEGKNE